MTSIKITVPLIVVAIIVFGVKHLDQLEKIAGWIYRGLARVVKGMDRRAVAHSVQGNINTARAALIKNIPEGVIGGKLKLQLVKPKAAEAYVRDGEVVVFMHKSKHEEENVANAVMAYIPRAVVPRARQYVDPDTMRAVDLTIASAILQLNHMPVGALDAFFEHHRDPALDECSDLRERLGEVDAIDLMGWLTRIMLNEYKIMGDKLHPNPHDEACLSETRELCKWLESLARREPGDLKAPLRHQGRYMNMGIMFVAAKGRLASEGLTPYRRRAKRLIYQDRCDVVYLTARDDNIPAARKLRDDLKRDALIEEVATFEYPLRSDFATRILHRERAIIVMLRRRHVKGHLPTDSAEVTDLVTEGANAHDAEWETASVAG